MFDNSEILYVENDDKEEELTISENTHSFFLIYINMTPCINKCKS